MKLREIEPTGSTTTLVARTLFHADTPLVKYSYKKDLSDMALFTSAPLSLDSFNFSKSLFGKRWTDADAGVFVQLMDLCWKLNQDPKAYWEELFYSKYEVSLNLQLGCQLNLIKDFKQFDILPGGRKGFGVASIVIPLELFI